MALIYPVRLRNMSDQPQTRWTSFQVPTRTLAQAGVTGQLGVVKPYGWAWQRGCTTGDQTRIWIRPSLAALELAKIELTDLRESPDIADMLGAVRLDWLLDKPDDAVLRFSVNDSGAPLTFDSFCEIGLLVNVYRFQARHQGWSAICYATVGVGQDVFDLQGYVVWSDPSSKSFTNDAIVSISHGEGYVGHLEKSLGQSVTHCRSPHLIFDAKVSGSLPDGFGVPFYGTLVAERDDGGIDDKARLQMATAAYGGPILALAGANCWAGHIGPHGAHIKAEARQTLPTATGFQDVLRSPFARRPWANAQSSGQTGDQGCFGRIKALHIFADADPAELLPLRYSSTDYWMRAHHALDRDGYSLNYFQVDPEQKSYETQPFWRVYGSKWKDVPNGWPSYGWDQGRGPLDPQHRGNLYMPAAAAILGDFILHDELNFLLAMDVRDVRHGIYGDKTLEAPRASGRLLQEWAHWWMSADGLQRAVLEDLARKMFAIVTSQPTNQVAGPVKVTQALSKFEGKNPLRNTTDPSLGYDAWIPWQESFVVDGLTAWAAIWQRIGANTECLEFLGHAVRLAHVVVDQGLIEHPALGAIPITYARWNAGGAPNDDAYLNAPRPGAKTTLEGDADMIYGGISLSWYSGAILAAASAGNDKAKTLRDVLYLSARNQTDWEWLVGDPQ
jgi:hypothetical protein